MKKIITGIRYIFTPENSESSYIDSEKSYHYSGVIKTVVWTVIAIISGILIGQLS